MSAFTVVLSHAKRRVPYSVPPYWRVKLTKPKRSAFISFQVTDNRIMGISYQFQGTGVVKFLELNRQVLADFHQEEVNQFLIKS
ncbi:MAG: hypothetical protein AAGG68_06440 [Bacteroidota bacterium]